MEEACHQKSDRQINWQIILTRTSKQPGAKKKVTVTGSGCLYWYHGPVPHTTDWIWRSLNFLNFPLLSPSQIAPKFYYWVEQCRTKIQTQAEAGYGREGFHVKIWLKQCEENELSCWKCVLFYESERLLERRVTSLFSLSIRSGKENPGFQLDLVGFSWILAGFSYAV